METLVTSQPFPRLIFPDCFPSKSLSSSKVKTTTMSYSQCPQIKREQNKEDYATSSTLSTLSKLQHYDTHPQFGHPHSPTHSRYSKSTWKHHRDIPMTELNFQLSSSLSSIPSLTCKSMANDQTELRSSDTHLIPRFSTHHHDIERYYTQVNNNQYVQKNSHLLQSASSAHTHPTPRILEPLPNIWSKVPPILPNKDRHTSPDHFRPHAELLLHLRRSPSLPPTPISPPSPHQLIKRSQSFPQSAPRSLAASIPIPPPAPSHTPITPIPHHRPRRANDYTGEFKREFCALLAKHTDARAQWEHFWRRRECTGRRPCIKSYLAFCDLYAEFAKLRRTHKYRVLGTRTNCECSYPSHSSTNSTRFSPY